MAYELCIANCCRCGRKREKAYYVCVESESHKESWAICQHCYDTFYNIIGWTMTGGKTCETTPES